MSAVAAAEMNRVITCGNALTQFEDLPGLLNYAGLGTYWTVESITQSAATQLKNYLDKETERPPLVRQLEIYKEVLLLVSTPGALRATTRRVIQLLRRRYQDLHETLSQQTTLLPYRLERERPTVIKIRAKL